ncbi:carbon monoxide dehydrogenase subunit G [Arthrobacter sp. NEB 688]|uniref:SRPBCC family protein n=1 Tax=Arthrobacter sp. NEB 688 TaxID=904039 RepID=UPI0015647992|nr:carbon monoxide dehydrogenase subunit G [Arthrobacter sp. NEB 688]QKE85651.1 carbon monoxide dehydrogenase subunit G [Arthrobacter sp. NEB 688]
MKISGSSTLESPVEQVWAAILDPAVLARCIPGCEALRTVGEDRYAMTVTAGVAAIKGTYQGEVALTDMDKPSALTLRANGSGAPGTIDADVRVTLSPAANGGTDLSYDADATVGGTIGGVGQRMLAGVTKKMAGQFFSALDADIAGEGPATPVIAPPGASAEAVAVPSEAPVGTTFVGRAASAPAGGGAGGGAASARDLVLAGMAGAVVALVGVALGARIGRTR